MILHFLLPAFNESEGIEERVHNILTIAKSIDMPCSVTIVNDGSTDGTDEKIRQMAAENRQIHLVNHAINQGPGKAFQSGFESIFSFANEDDVIITMDADNTHSETTIRMMLARLKEGYEVINGSVYVLGGMLIGVPFVRYLLTLGCNFIYRVLFPVGGIKQYTGFYRAYRVKILKRACESYEKMGEPLITANGFACSAEILVKLRRIPLFVTEVPMLIRFNLKKGRSKIKISKTIFEHLRIIFENLFRRQIF